MGYTVTIQQVAPQWIAAARGRAEPGDVSRTMLGLLGKVWPFVKASGIKTDGQNVAIYYKDHTIEAGARLFTKFEGEGEIVCVASPAGLAAMVIHMGPYEKLGEAHHAIRDWCRENGRELEGTNWEVYGHHEEDPARRRTDVFYLVR
jgi:effector-binding domain-containing protein